MGVDVVDVGRDEAGAADGRFHGAVAAVAVIGRGGDVEGVAGEAVADHLGVDLRPALPRVFQLLQHQDAGALAHHEAVAVPVIGPGCAGGIVVEVGGHGPAGDEPGDADLAHRRLRPAGDHHVGVAPLDEPHGVAHGVGAGGAGGDHRMVGTLEVVAYGNLSRGEVDQGRGNEERADPPGTFLVQFYGGVGDGRKSADPRADIDPGTAAIRLVLRRPAGIAHRLVGGGHGVEDEIIDPALVLRAHHLPGVEGARDIGAAASAPIDAGNFAGDLAGVVGRIEGGDPAGPRTAGENGFPGGLDAPAQG